MSRTVDGNIAVLLREDELPATRSRVAQIAALVFCGLALLANLGFMLRLDSKQERFLNYGKFQGEYESERTAVRRKLTELTAELQTERAWKSSIKADLGELLALVQNVQMREVIQRMIEER